MQDVQMSKTDLLVRLRENRDKHHSTYEQAVVKYREAVEATLTRLLAEAKQHKWINHRALGALPVPEDHTEDYDVAIGMLEADQRDSLVLDNNDYRRYILDQWEWAQAFARNSLSYLAQ